MPLATTLRLLAKARGLSPGRHRHRHSARRRRHGQRLAAGEKLPGKEQLDALARTFGVPAGALLARTRQHPRSGAHAGRARPARRLPRAQQPKQQGALLEVARSMHPARSRSHARRRKQVMSELKRKEYEQLLERLQLELVAMARWLQHTGRAWWCCSKAATPPARAARSTPSPSTSTRANAAWSRCPSPASARAAQWYFQRYVPHLPAAGEIVLFDRSWYNRAGVEKVMGFATDAQVKAFLRQAPAFEKMLVDDGILLFKYWLCCDQDAAGATLRRTPQGSAQALEALADRRRSAQALRGLHPRARGDAQGHAHATRAVDAGRFQRPEPRPADADPRPAYRACPTPKCRRRSSSSRRCQASRRRNATACSSR